MGDFNINLNDRTSPIVRELETTTAFWGLKAQIKGNTRIGTRNGVIKGTSLDNIYINSEAIAQAGILNWNFSDHLAVVVKRKMKNVESSKVEFKGRSYRHYVREDLQDKLLQHNWGDSSNQMTQTILGDN